MDILDSMAEIPVLGFLLESLLGAFISGSERLAQGEMLSADTLLRLATAWYMLLALPAAVGFLLGSVINRFRNWSNDDLEAVIALYAFAVLLVSIVSISGFLWPIPGIAVGYSVSSIWYAMRYDTYLVHVSSQGTTIENLLGQSWRRFVYAMVYLTAYWQSPLTRRVEQVKPLAGDERAVAKALQVRLYVPPQPPYYPKRR